MTVPFKQRASVVNSEITPGIVNAETETHMTAPFKQRASVVNSEITPGIVSRTSVTCKYSH